jgi:hypothetical protein
MGTSSIRQILAILNRRHNLSGIYRRVDLQPDTGSTKLCMRPVIYRPTRRVDTLRTEGNIDKRAEAPVHKGGGPGPTSTRASQLHFDGVQQVVTNQRSDNPLTHLHGVPACLSFFKRSHFWNEALPLSSSNPEINQ